jgi:hypothetical protein
MDTDEIEIEIETGSDDEELAEELSLTNDLLEEDDDDDDFTSLYDDPYLMLSFLDE